MHALTLWLGVLMAGYGATMALVYPIMVENEALMTTYMQTFPEEFMAAFGKKAPKKKGKK